MRVTYETLPDGNAKEFGVLHLATDLPGDEQPEFVVVANGYLENIAALKGSAAALINVAEQNGQPMQVTLHDSPLTGKSAYGLAYRTERYERVVNHVTHDGDLPVRLKGHSWGFPQAVAVGRRAVADGRPIESVVGLNPNGLTRISVNPRTVAYMLTNAVGEAKFQAMLVMRCNQIAVNMGKNALEHILGNIPKAAQEGYNILTHSVVDDTVALERDLAAVDGSSRVRVVAGRYDSICPSEPMGKNLLEAGFPQSNFYILDTCHGGPLVDPSFAPAMYGHIMLQDDIELGAVAA